DIESVNYSDIGMDKTALPINRQEGNYIITISIANLKLSNTSKRAPETQKQNAWSLHNLIEDVHKVIHGFKPHEKSGKLVRVSKRRIKRDDGVQLYKVSYSMGAHNV